MPSTDMSSSHPQLQRARLDAQRRDRQHHEQEDRRKRDKQLWFSSPEGKRSISTAMIKHLRHEIPKDMMEELIKEGETHYAGAMQFQDIWVCPTEFQDWHIPRDIVPNRDELFAAMMQSLCKDGNRRFQWRWVQPSSNYGDGTRKWEYCLTDMQKCPAKTHDGYQAIWNWLHAPHATRGSFEDLTNINYDGRNLRVA